MGRFGSWLLKIVLQIGVIGILFYSFSHLLPLFTNEMRMRSSEGVWNIPFYSALLSVSFTLLSSFFIKRVKQINSFNNESMGIEY